MHARSAKPVLVSLGCILALATSAAAQADGKAPEVKRLEIVPGARVLSEPNRWQQLAVRAHFADGTVKDVTRQTVFSSSDEAVAQVGRTGLVEFAKTGEVAILCRYLLTMQSARLTYLDLRNGFVWPDPPVHNDVDRHVFAKLKLLSIPPSDLCSDEDFLRRVFLDIGAILPTPAEVRLFLRDTDKDKRAKWIDKLLARPEYADFWTLKWADVLRISRRTLGDKGAQVYRTWLHEHVAQSTPLDHVVRELLTASGNTFDVGPANYFRVAKEPQELAETTAQLFLGVRLGCAKCHNHPFESWTQDDYFHLAAFFAQQKPLKKFNPKKIDADVISFANKGDVKHPRTGQNVAPRFLGGAAPRIANDDDRRLALAHWLTAADNPFFARSVVNRVWYHLMGRGIVDPVDDFRDSNPSANDELLAALAKDFVAHKFDVKHLIRTIVNSRTYQLSARSSALNRDDQKYFSHALTKLLTAEQLLDALCEVTEVPEDFKGYPRGTRAVQLVDGDVNHPFLRTFGQPPRELPCECEREGDANLAQALQLINGATVHAKLTHPKNRIGRLLAKKTPEPALLDELYLATLSRLPRQTEARAALDYVAQATDKRKSWEDVQWALFNTKEFMFRH